MEKKEIASRICLSVLPQFPQVVWFPPNGFQFFRYLAVLCNYTLNLHFISLTQGNGLWQPVLVSSHASHPSFFGEGIFPSWGCAGKCFWLADQCAPSPWPRQWPQHWACSPTQVIKASSPGLLLLSFSLGLPLAGKWNISSCNVLLGYHMERACLRKTTQRLTVVRGGTNERAWVLMMGEMAHRQPSSPLDLHCYLSPNISLLA